MFFVHSITPLLTSSSELTAALPYLAAGATAVLGYLGARYTATAPLQSSLNDAFRSLTDELQTERARLIVRISELEGEIIRQRGVINEGLAREAAMKRLAEKGLDIPGGGI